MIKTLRNLFKQDKEKFVVPKSVQAVIPIKTIWEDGIFLVGRNKYAKTFKFEDINYAVASREDKEAMFLEYSELLNALDSGATTKITINNRRLNNNNFSAVIPYDLEQQRKESKEFLDDLTTRDQRMMFAVLTMVHTAETKEQLDNDTEALLTTARKHLCQFAVLKFQQMDGLNTALPFGIRRIDVMLWRMPEATGAMGFTLTVIFSIFMLTQYVSLKEYQYPKVTTLLCALPYPRKMIVLSKYCFPIIIYAVCCLVFGIDTIIFPKLGTFDIRMAAITFLVITIPLSIYFPALYKLGYEKTKFAFVIIIMASPVLFAFLFKPENAIRFHFLDTVSTTTIAILSVIISFITFSISAILSIQFFENSDLT